MNSLVKFIESETRRTGKSPSTKQLRSTIKNRKKLYESFNNELDDLYDKTFQYEEMQRAIKNQRGRLIHD